MARKGGVTSAKKVKLSVFALRKQRKERREEIKRERERERERERKRERKRAGENNSLIGLESEGARVVVVSDERRKKCF